MNLNFIGFIKNRIKERKEQKKNFEFEEKVKELRKNLDIILQDTNISNDLKKMKISMTLSQFITLMKLYDKKLKDNQITEKGAFGDEYDFIETYFKDDSQIQKAIKLSRENNTYYEIINSLNEHDENQTIWEIYDRFQQHYVQPKQRNFEYSNIYESLDNIVSLIKNNGNDEYETKDMIDKCKRQCVYYVANNIRKCKDNAEKIRMSREFLHSDVIKDYRELFLQCLDKDVKNRIILEEKGVKIADKDKCPELLEVIDRETLLEKNDELAREKLSENEGKIKEEDLAFVRLVKEDRLSRLGLLEPIGQFYEPRKTDSFFDNAIKIAYPEENVEDFEQIATENRQTIHFVVNALVIDINNNKFRDGKVMYILPWHDIENQVVNLLSADSYIKGTTKAKTVLMSIQNYRELIQNDDYKKEFERLDVVLFDEDEIKKYISDENEINQYALELYLNSQNKVFGEVSTQYYNFKDGEYATQYLQKVEEKLQSLSQQKGISHVTHIDSEHNEQDIQIGVKNKRKEIELFIEMVKNEAFSYLGEDFDYQPILMALGYINGVGYSDDEGQVIFEEEYQERKMLYENKLVDFLKKIPPEKFKEIIKKYNAVMMERYKVARKEKDEEYLSEGLMTQEDYDGIYEKRNNDEKGEKQ